MASRKIPPDKAAEILAADLRRVQARLVATKRQLDEQLARVPEPVLEPPEERAGLTAEEVARKLEDSREARRTQRSTPDAKKKPPAK